MHGTAYMNEALDLVFLHRSNQIFHGLLVLTGCLGFLCGGPTVDNTIEQIRVRIYVSAGNRLYLDVYFTSSSDDSICYDVRYALVPLHRFRARDLTRSSTSGGDDIELVDAQRPVLEGFNLVFGDGGHHADEVGIRLEPGLVRVWLNDRNDDDPFSWEV
jgi:hypothetical protein